MIYFTYSNSRCVNGSTNQLRNRRLRVSPAAASMKRVRVASSRAVRAKLMYLPTRVAISPWTLGGHRPTFSRTASTVLSQRQQHLVSTALQKNAEGLSNTHLEELLKGKPPNVQKEILRINTEARPIALQIALLVPLLAALLGLFMGFRMTKLPDPEPSSAAESLLAG